MTPKEPARDIGHVIASVGTDAVLATRLVSVSAGERQGGSWDYTW